MSQILIGILKTADMAGPGPNTGPFDDRDSGKTAQVFFLIILALGFSGLSQLLLEPTSCMANQASSEKSL